MNKKFWTFIIFLLGMEYTALSVESQAAEPLLKLSLNKKIKNCQVVIEWASDDKIDLVYSTSFCALGNAGGIINVSGGIAVAAPGVKEAIGKLYSHSCYPSDYSEKSKPVVEIFADGRPVLKATENGTIMSGELVTSEKPLTAKEVKAVLTGTLKAVDMEILEERIFRADAPHFMAAHIRIKYTKEILVNTLYHQMIQANPSFINNDLTVLGYGKNGICTIKEGMPGGLKNGLFYTAENGRYAGFLSGSGDYIKFRYWKNGNYTASYKIIVEKEKKKAGDVSESFGISCWGNTEGEVSKLLEITEKINMNKAPTNENAEENFIAKTIQRSKGIKQQ